MEERYLLAVHVGPVQGFIATARRSRDLWFGSWLLSELAKAAALEVVRRSGNDLSCLIFPAPAGISDLESAEFTVANKIVAWVGRDPAEIGEAARRAVLRRLDELFQRTIDEGKIRGKFDLERARLQLEDFPEFFWASYPLGQDYRKTRSLVEALLNCRKATRNFAPVTWGSSSPKCSLDGSRESVIPDSAHHELDDHRLRRDYDVRRGEHLCGVCLLKRHGKRGEDEHFFSTSHVAALPLLERLTDAHRALVDEYIGELRRLGIPPDVLNTLRSPHPVFGHHDGHLLFEERLHEFFQGDKLLQATQALRNFLGKALEGDKPYPYYALILADGDNMGKVIDAQETAEQHRALSRTQSLFAAEAREIVRLHRGSLIYSGGDDVVALVPLHTAIACARRLAESFRGRLAAFKAKEGGVEVSPTLSVGMAIAHHLSPLSDALALARQAEGAAKSLAGKNGLAVTLSKRGGIERTVKGAWGMLDRRLERFAELHRMEAIPDGAAYELHELARQFGSSEGEGEAAVQEAVRPEIKRILRRKKAERGLRPLAEHILAELEELIERQVSSPADLRQFAEELIISREFAAAMDLANAPLCEPPGEEASET
ncbi:MAG: type III-B CRISPR-associated protein Cas10/Cmr2 [Clostridia bacterium]|nr:type III-B CRISPR-associated protein Cas10/Cmr2 [Clostridia bacterium]